MTKLELYCVRLGVAENPTLIEIKHTATVGNLQKAVAMEIQSSFRSAQLQVFPAKRDDAWLLEESDDVNALRRAMLPGSET